MSLLNSALSSATYPSSVLAFAAVSAKILGRLKRFSQLNVAILRSMRTTPPRCANRNHGQCAWVVGLNLGILHDLRLAADRTQRRPLPRGAARATRRLGSRCLRRT